MRNTLLRLVLFAIVVMFPLTVVAQHNHSEGHPDYSTWESKKTSNCCSDQDCGDLNEDEIRETPTGTEVIVKGGWCPVKPEHYLIKGKSPDWNKPHACINNSPNASYANDCDRLLCFVPKGGW